MIRGEALTKRVLDLLLGGAALAVAAVPMAFIALAIRVSMGPPILYRSRRAGLNEQPFTLLKFRTMEEKDPRDSSVSSSDGTRLTSLGTGLRRWSLDELPGLINVIRGDMSLVGPRPLPLVYLERYSAEQRRRHLVKPGMTGWAQVNGRNALDWEQRFEADGWYVDNHSPGLDLRILWRTLGLVLEGEGVAAEGHATMPEFRGTPPPPT